MVCNLIRPVTENTRVFWMVYGIVPPLLGHELFFFNKGIFCLAIKEWIRCWYDELVRKIFTDVIILLSSTPHVFKLFPFKIICMLELFNRSVIPIFESLSVCLKYSQWFSHIRRRTSTVYLLIIQYCPPLLKKRANPCVLLIIYYFCYHSVSFKRIKTLTSSCTCKCTYLLSNLISSRE